MAFLYLVRHGQAGDRVLTGGAGGTGGTGGAGAHAIEQAYDVLSERGHRQAAATARSLARRRTPGSTVPVISGPLHRQQDTAAHIADELHSPTPRVDEAWREFDTDAVVGPWLAQNPGTVAEMREASAAAEESTGGRRALARITGTMLEDAMAWWVSGPGHRDVGEFSDFRAGVLQGVDSAGDLARDSGSAVVVTSAGVIALCAVESLGLPPERWPAMASRILTASVSLFRLGGDGLDLLSLNEHAHLDEPDTDSGRPLRRFS